jgi:DNA-directed RNA polymerase I, II, and III subunit RPABC2
LSVGRVGKMADEYEPAADVDEGEEVVEDAENDCGLEGKEAVLADPLQSLYRHHPECKVYYAEVITEKLVLLAAPPDHATRADAPDPNHRSQPWLSQYERTKILGFRANQLAQGAIPYITPPAHIVNTIDIARLELKERRLPFIISRVMPDGNYEFWRLSDLMII